MYIRNIGKFMFGQLKNGNFVRTVSQNGKTTTEILDSMGNIIKQRIKTVQRTPITGEVEEVCKKAFPNHDKFSAVTVGKVTNVFENGLKGESIGTTTEYKVNRNLFGKPQASSENILMREEAEVTNLFKGGVYEPDFHIDNPSWQTYWGKRKIKIGIDDTLNVPRNENPFEVINIPLETTERTGAWNRRIVLYTPEFDGIANIFFGKQRKNSLKDLIDISSYNANECYSRLVDKEYFW